MAYSVLANRAGLSRTEISGWKNAGWGMWTLAQRNALSGLKSSQPYRVQRSDSLTIWVTREGWPKGATNWAVPEAMIKAPHGTCGFHLTLTTALLLRAQPGLQREACGGTCLWSWSPVYSNGSKLVVPFSEISSRLCASGQQTPTLMSVLLALSPLLPSLASLGSLKEVGRAVTPKLHALGHTLVPVSSV